MGSGAEAQANPMSGAQGHAREQLQLGLGSDLVAKPLDRDGKHAGQLLGKSPYMQSVHVMGGEALRGQMVRVHITEARQSSLAGELLQAQKTAGDENCEAGLVGVKRELEWGEIAREVALMTKSTGSCGKRWIRWTAGKRAATSAASCAALSAVRLTRNRLATPSSASCRAAARAAPPAPKSRTAAPRKSGH